MLAREEVMTDRKCRNSFVFRTDRFFPYCSFSACVFVSSVFPKTKKR